jgi:hypothetical protein
MRIVAGTVRVVAINSAYEFRQTVGKWLLYGTREAHSQFCADCVHQRVFGGAMAVLSKRRHDEHDVLL